MCKEILPGSELVKCATFLNTYAGERLHVVLGQLQVRVEYSDKEKEAFSMIYVVKKLHQFLNGRRFILVTDHKPLLTILGPKKRLPTHSAAQLQRWAITLTVFQYDLEFGCTSAPSNADGFSRLPLQGQAKAGIERWMHLLYFLSLCSILRSQWT